MRGLNMDTAVRTSEERVWAAHQDRAGACIRCEISLPEETQFPRFVEGGCRVDLTTVVLMHLMEEKSGGDHRDHGGS